MWEWGDNECFHTLPWKLTKRPSRQLRACFSLEWPLSNLTFQLFFWISPAIRHLVVAPSQAGLVEDGPGMGNRASQQNGHDPRAWRHLYHSQDISVSLSFTLSPPFPSFPSSSFLILMTPFLSEHIFFLSRFVCFFEWTSCLRSPPCISFLVHSLKLFY